MSTAPVSRSPAPGRRLVGVDVARGLAVLGMMSVHILTADAPGAQQVWLITEGRSAALFAVLAGISVAMATGRDRPEAWLPSAAAMATRAALIGVVGLTLGVVPGRIAVILVNYAILFLAACLFLRLSARWLTVVAAVWLSVTPALSMALRMLPLPLDSPGPVPSWFDLARLDGLLTNLLLTGYYPALTWLGYLLVGMAVGRSHRLYRGSGWWLVAVGGVLALGAWLAASALNSVFDVQQRVSLPIGHPSARFDPLTALYGTVPTNSWWWLLTDYRHSGTSFDLVGTTGTALVALGLCLVLSRLIVARVVLYPLAAAGSMPLTLYTLHVWIEAVRVSLIGGEGRGTLATLTVEALALIVFAVAWQLSGRALGASGKGPLEWVLTTASNAAREAAVGPRNQFPSY